MYQINSLQSELEDIRGSLQRLKKLENDLEDIRVKSVNMGKEIMELEKKCAELNLQRIESLLDEKIEKFSEGIYQRFETLKDEANDDTNTLGATVSSIYGSISNYIYNLMQKAFAYIMPKRITHNKS